MSRAIARAKLGGARIAQLFLLLALVWQGVVLQTHAHYAPAGAMVAGVATVSPSGTAKAVADPASVSAPCLLCEEQALFGAFMLAAPLVVAAPVALPAWYRSDVRRYAAARQSSHSWQSRAPPLLS